MSKHKTKSVKFNFIMNFILTASNFIFPLITFPYVSRVLQVAANGKIAFVTSIASYFLMVASLGIPVYGIRACAKVRDNKKQLSKTVQEILIINLVVASIVLVLYVMTVLFVPLLKAYQELFFINMIGLILNVLGVNWLFQALEQYAYITVRSIIFKMISIVLMFILVHQPSDYIIYGAIIVLASGGSNILNFIKMHDYVSFKIQKNYNFKQHIKPIIILFSQNIVISIYTNLDTVLLRLLRDEYQVGIFNAAIKLKAILISLVTSLGNVLLPRMSYYVKYKMDTEFRLTLLKALNFTLLLSFAVATYFVIMSKETILFLAGDLYVESIVGMQLLTIAIIPIAITGILGIQVLIPLEKEKFVLYSVTAGAIINLIMNLILIPKYGATGAAISTMIAEFIVLFVQIYYTQHILKNIYQDIRWHTYIVTAVVSGSIIFGVKLLIPHVFISLVVTSIVFFIVYLLLLVVFKDIFIKEIIYQFKYKIKKIKG